MFTQLIESEGRRGRGRPVVQGAASFALHLALGVGAVQVTRAAAPPPPRAPRAVAAIYLPPDRPPAPRAVSPAAPAGAASLPEAPVSVPVPLDPPVGIPPITGGPRIDPSRFVLGRSVRPCDDCTAAAPIGPAPFLAESVDQPAEVERQPAPVYPPVLRSAGIAGKVLVEFVVDTAGRVELGSIRILEADHRAFGESAAEAIAQSRFRPARVRGAPVRQLVRQPIRFLIR